MSLPLWEKQFSRNQECKQTFKRISTTQTAHRIFPLNKQNTHKHTHTNVHRFDVQVDSETHPQYTSKNKHTYSDYPQLPHQKRSWTRQILAHMLNFITLFTVSVYSWMCESASAPQQPSSCHYCSALYCCQNHRWQATFPGRLGTNPPLGARCRQRHLTAIAPDTHTFHIFSLSMRRQREKRRQWKATVSAINCQSHLHPEAQPFLNPQNKHTHTSACCK